MPIRWRWPAPPVFGAEQLIFLTDVEGVLDADSVCSVSDVPTANI